MGKWLKGKLDVFTDFETQFIEQTADDKKKNLPPVIKGRSRRNDPDKKTILIYSHYDVMPVSFLFARIVCIDILYSPGQPRG